MKVKLLTEHHLEFLSLKEGCRGLSESTLVKMSHCWKSHSAALFCLSLFYPVTGRNEHACMLLIYLLVKLYELQER